MERESWCGTGTGSNVSLDFVCGAGGSVYGMLCLHRGVVTQRSVVGAGAHKVHGQPASRAEDVFSRNKFFDVVQKNG